MLPRAGRALDLERVAVEVVVALQRLDQQVVDREPDRPAPVGVAAEQAGVRLGRRRSRRGTPGRPWRRTRTGCSSCTWRQRADAVRREELVLVEHVAQHALQPLARRDGQQAVRRVPSRPVRAAIVGDVPGQVRAVRRGTSCIRFWKPGQPVDDLVLSSTSHGEQRDDARPSSAPAAAMRSARPRAAGRSRSRPPRPTGPCRRACSSRRRSRRSARRTWRRRPRRPGPRSPARAPSRASCAQ